MRLVSGCSYRSDECWLLWWMVMMNDCIEHRCLIQFNLRMHCRQPFGKNLLLSFRFSSNSSNSNQKAEKYKRFAAKIGPEHFSRSLFTGANKKLIKRVQVSMCECARVWTEAPTFVSNYIFLVIWTRIEEKKIVSDELFCFVFF